VAGNDHNKNVNKLFCEWFCDEIIITFPVKMSAEEDYKLREIQREYLDFLDDDVGVSRMLRRWWSL